MKKTSDHSLSTAKKESRDEGENIQCCFSVYFDFGQGYSEGTKQIFQNTQQSEEQYHALFRIPQGADGKAVRFVPMERNGCVLSNLSVSIDGKKSKLSSWNGYANKETVLVFDQKSSIEFETKEGASDVEISAKRSWLPDNVISLFQTIQKKQKETERERCSIVEQQEITIAELNNVLAKQQAEFSALQWEYNNLVNAFFWKITKPFRVTLDFLKRNKYFALLDKGLHSLKAFGVKATWEKIKHYRRTQRDTEQVKKAEALWNRRIDTVQDMIRKCTLGGGDVFGKELLSDNLAEERVLLISHELNLTGAPIALQYFAESLQRQGKYPVVMAPHDGKLRLQLAKENIPVVIYPALYESDFVSECAGLFSMVMINTIVGAPLVSRLNGIQTPVLWWIHEGETCYHPGILDNIPEELKDNVHVYCVSDYAEKGLKNYRPKFSVNRLLFCLPDFAKQLPPESTPLVGAEGKTVFACVGALAAHKGQDVLAQAIRLLSNKERNKCLFVFVGQAVEQPTYRVISKLCKEYPDSVRYISELSREDIMQFYTQMDCEICASRGDSVSITVAEAMALSKLVICSENAGISAMLEENNSGFVYRNDSPKALAAAIGQVIGLSDSSEMRQRARLAFEKHFDPQTFDKKTEEIFDQIISVNRTPVPDKMSVVIPTYNAGAEFEPLLRCLRSQHGIGELEIVIVDSGSKDNTLDIARRYGAEVIEIPQKDFSHSYARNLGMEKATGKYVMMMTQDAVPDGTYWLWKMVQPILKDGVVAVSCREVPKPDCDLWGRMGIHIHWEYMGVMEEDRILSLPASKNFDSLRKNAQLADVACMFERETFLEFHYRGNFAEDLDIGLRMIQAKKQLALLSSAKVIHSHTRPAFYYLQRGVIGVITVKEILQDYPIHKANSTECMDQIITAYAAEKKFSDDMLLLSSEIPSDKNSFNTWADGEFERIRTFLSSASSDEVRRQVEKATPYTDPKFQQFVLDFLDKRGENFHADLAGTFDQGYFVKNLASPFLELESGSVKESEMQELAGAMEKYTAQLAGDLLAGYVYNHKGEDPCMDELCQELTRGV